MSIEEKIKVLDILTDLFCKLKEMSDNQFIENYAKDQMRNVIHSDFSVKETLSRINPFTHISDMNGIVCTLLEYSDDFDIDEYISKKPHYGFFYDVKLKQFMLNMGGNVLKGCVGKLVSKRSKKCIRCFKGASCKGCPYYHIHDIEFVRGKHPSEIPGSDRDYVSRRMMHDLLCLEK